MISQLRVAWRNRLQNTSDDRGAVALLVAIIVGPLLLASAAIGVDLSLMQMNGQRMQRAADAAALAGVVYMPGDPVKARTIALDIAKKNGYDDAASDTTVQTAQGDKASQLKVTINSHFGTLFAGALGMTSGDMTRTSVADYSGPVSMGSPCNIFGNEPDGGTGQGSVASSGCDRTPQFWANAAGPGSPKANGDAFNTRTCAAGNSGCSGSTNTDYDPRGNFYRMTVTGSAPSLNVQVFDPAMVHVADLCGANLKSSWSKNANPNPYTNDAKTRYVSGETNPYCTGDQEFDTDASKAVTTFTVRSPSVSGDPMQSPIVPGCTKQFKGYGGTPVDNTNKLDFETLLDSSKAGKGYDPELAQVFRQWVSLCTIANPVVGDYFIQIRTNIPYGAQADSYLNSTTDVPSMNWSGHNRFSLRVDAGGSSGNVSIAGAGRMVIYANTPSSDAEFYLSRIGSGSAGRTLYVSLFDAGDAAQAGTITILPPAEMSSMDMSKCLGLGAKVGTSSSGASLGSNCSLTNVQSSSGWNGITQVISIPVPANYKCNDRDPTACWFKIRFNYPGGTTDTTSWWSSLDGQPVRIIR